MNRAWPSPTACGGLWSSCEPWAGLLSRTQGQRIAGRPWRDFGNENLGPGRVQAHAGHTFEWTPQGASQQPRVDLTANRHVVQDMSEAIELVDRAFMASVQSMVATNEAHGCAQVNLLSGGLDSRLVLLATQQHAERCKASALPERGVWTKPSPHKSPAQGTRHRFHSLGQGVHDVAGHGGDYDGTVNHLASAHHRSALEATLDGHGGAGLGQTANVCSLKGPEHMPRHFRWARPKL